eukprot:ctg_6268.g496
MDRSAPPSRTATAPPSAGNARRVRGTAEADAGREADGLGG